MEKEFLADDRLRVPRHVETGGCGVDGVISLTSGHIFVSLVGMHKNLVRKAVWNENESGRDPSCESIDLDTVVAWPLVHKKRQKDCGRIRWSRAKLLTL